MRKLMIFALAGALILSFTGCKKIETTITETVNDVGDSLMSQANSEDTSEVASESSSASADTSSRATEEDLIPVVDDLLDRGFEICDIFYNLPAHSEEFVKDEDGNDTTWAPVTDERFTTLQELKDFTEETYTAEYAAADFYSFALEGDYPVFAEKDGILCANVDVGGLGWSTVWKTDTLTIVTQTENSVTVEMEVGRLGMEDDASAEVETAQLTLARVNGEWRLDSSVIQ